MRTFIDLFKMIFSRMKNNKSNRVVADGFLPYTPQSEDWKFGAIGGPVLVPNGQWIKYLPSGERQRKRNAETMACVTFSALNALEALLKLKYGADLNRSDRFTAKKSGTSEAGNTFGRVGDSIRKDGTVFEDVWPYPEDISRVEFYKEIPNEITKEGFKFLDVYKVNTEYVGFTQENFKEALKYSPLQIAVNAWNERNGMYYHPAGAGYNHATLLVGYVEGSHWIILDSYEPFIKQIEWSYPFYSNAFRYNIENLTGNEKGKILFDRFKDKFIILPENRGEVWYVSSNGYLEKVTFAISQPQLFELVHKALREKRAFTGLTNNDFKELREYVGVTYGDQSIKEAVGLAVADENFLKNTYQC